jgi:hypothetical protein
MAHDAVGLGHLGTLEMRAAHAAPGGVRCRRMLHERLAFAGLPIAVLGEDRRTVRGVFPEGN